MKVIFLDFDGVITTYESRWCIEARKLELLEEIIKVTGAKIVVTSSWKHGYSDVENFKKSLYDKRLKKCSPLCYDSIEKSFDIFNHFIENIYDITDSRGSWRGDEIERWLDKHEEEVENYVILDDDSDFKEEQLFHFVETDSYEGLTEREVKLCISVLENCVIRNPIRLNLVLTTMWRNGCDGIGDMNKINGLLSEYYDEVSRK